MNPKSDFENRLELLGSALRERPSITERVLCEVRQSLAGGPVTQTVRATSFPKIRRRWPFVATTVAAMFAAVVIALTLFPERSVGWEEVKKAVVSQKWIRLAQSYQDGRHGTIWLAPGRMIWAFKTHDHIEFSDGLRNVTYDYKTGDKEVMKGRLSESDRQRMLPVDFSRDDAVLGQWLFGERIVEEHRREVTENGKAWIEFELVFARGGNRGTLRVDPKTRLPVSLVFAGHKEAAKPVEWAFDYPMEGPDNIYAMGAPAAAKIDDLSPPVAETRVLDGMAATRSRMGDFRLDVATTPGFGFYRVWRKGSRWRVDFYLPKPRAHLLEQPTDGTTLEDWFDRSLAQCDQYPRYLCDGRTVYEQTWSAFGENSKSSGWHPSRNIAPGDLLSATGGSRVPKDLNLPAEVYPDRFGTLGWKYEFDPRPADAPGCVVCKLSASLATAEPQVAHEWYYVDPRKGYAVVRAELFDLPPGATANPEASPLRSTRVMDGFRQSPRGFWYPTMIRATDVAVDQTGRLDSGTKLARTTRTIRYSFDFNAPLPDSLFASPRLPGN